MDSTLQIVLVVGGLVGAIATLFRDAADMPLRVTCCVGVGVLAAYLVLGASGWL